MGSWGVHRGTRQLGAMWRGRGASQEEGFLKADSVVVFLIHQPILDVN